MRRSLFFVLLAAGLAHARYSRLGFNPTDEGYMLAASRRLLDGQVPHRDYITIRPAGTHLLHAHLLLWTGDRLLLWSRFFVWAELALAAWLWVRVAEACFGELPAAARWPAAAVGFAASAHSFPMMPWNTIDGALAFAAGAAVRLLAPERLRWASWLLLGTAPLFRQTFLLPLPVMLFAFGDAHRIRAWLLMALPGACYAAWMACAGALPDAWVQLTSHAVSAGRILSFREGGTVLAWAFAACAWGLLAARASPWRPLRFAGLAACAAPIVAAAATLDRERSGMCHAWLAFGALLASVPWLAWEWRRDLRPLKGALLALAAGWGVSISEGWPSPALACGAITAVLLACLGREESRLAPGTARRPWITLAASAAAAGMAVAGLDACRTTMVYRDIEPRFLRHDLGGVLPGARGILTNRRTDAFLKELAELSRQAAARGRQVAVVPCCAQFWALSPRPNPLSSDWPCDAELLHPALRERVFREVEAGRGEVTFLVSRVDEAMLAYLKMAPPPSAVADRIRQWFRKVGQGRWFEVYE